MGDQEWSAATRRLVGRGWVNPDDTVTDAGTAERGCIEIETDEHCAGLWKRVGEAGARGFASLVTPIDDAFVAAGTFGQFH